VVAGLLALRASHGGWAAPRARATLVALLVAIGYGGFDELHQALVPGRNASLADWLADAVGALLAVPCSAWIARLSSRGSGLRVGRGR